MKRIEKILLCGGYSDNKNIDYSLIAVFNVSNEEFTFPALESESHIGVIDWGDDTTEEYDSSLSYTHTYSEVGTYEVKINCDVQSIVEAAFVARKDLLSFSCTTATKYGERVFASCANMHTVAISDNVEILPYYIFGAAGIRAFNFPAKLKQIGKMAFYASAITGEIIMPEGVTTIGVEAFKSCNNITKIVFPDTIANFEVEDDRSECLHYCSNLEEIVIGNNQIALTDIPDYFYRSTDEQNIKLHTVKIAEGVTKIGRRAFFIGAYGINDCNVYLPSTITQLGSWSAYGNQTGHNHTLYVHYNGTADEWTAIEKSGTIFYADFDDVFLITKDGEKHYLDYFGTIS